MVEIAVIIVTHNSQDVLPRCIEALEQQTKRLEIIIVDSGSKNVRYLDAYRKKYGIRIILKENIGFSRANNIGYQAVSQAAKSILFLNPDAFPAPNSIEKAHTFLIENENTGCVGGRLLGYDINSDCPTDLLDSTGVFRKWYGCWYDRSQGDADKGQFVNQEDVPGACGAFLFCRRTMLEQVALRNDDKIAIFDPDFFLYKEDIELCIRIRKAGWRIVYHPEISVFHCRGWKKDRQHVPYPQRLTAAQSELLLYNKHPSPYIIWALFKYLLVRWLKI
ncbi:MAG: glycosyltransferase family 2 protein [Candidatus Electrothrix sp. ATG1]|nr:glycosyltransferase family 2 protein [Candidatus Electrothrix sp. ATG1]